MPSFLFKNRSALNTGKLYNVQNPIKALSDDTAPSWGGEIDLENNLQEPKTTVIDRDFNQQTIKTPTTTAPNETYFNNWSYADAQHHLYSSPIFLGPGSSELNSNFDCDKMLTTRNPLGSNTESNTNIKILIFIRYGKLLAQPNLIKDWHGILEGLSPPNNNYGHIATPPNAT
ncbi:hypothetical protein ES676_00950 [Bizionia saleffrena]|uniref:Uncharacterized protein n=1 Tax=Bizionia saleffrena TaxID=291189 RepID=A0A8H2QKK8_9FLAO|nr:hypothetical protein [Bizionia saleffrena]TYB80268.1 hypothetical protein ES676_00950 [Bizionia saleffrena]